MPAKLTTEQFVAKAKSVWGDMYDYSSVEYQGTDVPVKIICPKHGAFNMTPHHHITGHRGCLKCLQVTDTEGFIERAKEVHGDKYDYMDYRRYKNKIPNNTVGLKEQLYFVERT